MMRVLSQRFRLPAIAAVMALLSATGVASAATNPTAYTTQGAWTFQSAPRLHPPKLSTDAKGVKSPLAPGDFLVANFKNILKSQPFAGQPGPLIVDSHLQPVWFLPVTNGEFANNLAVQRYNGKPALSWWQGTITATGITTKGTDYLVDQHYKPLGVGHFSGQNGWAITQHEMLVSGHDAWVTANKVLTVPTGTIPGCNTCTQLVDSAVQEYDLKTGNLVYTWDALQHKHIPLTETQQPANPKIPWDAYHINSIQLLSNGRFLTSMRNTWAGYLVDVKSGTIVWKIGGKNSSFRFASTGARFFWQHDVELHSNGLLSLFDDHCCQLTGNPKQPLVAPTGQSRGLLLRLDFKKMTASYVHQYVVPTNPRHTAFQGNMQLLPDHNVVVGWGSAPAFSEFTYSGKLITDTAFPTPDLTYRAYVTNWVGLPSTSQLRAVAVKRKGRTTVYASWNGATKVAGWRVLGGSSSKHLATVATALRKGFETALPLSKAYHSYVIVALDSRGHVLAKKAFGAGSGSSGSGSGGSGSGGSGPGGY